MENNRNNYQKFEEQLQMQEDRLAQGEEKASLLLHACCCPCSTHCIEVLQEYFDITLYFYNPNIDNREEYQKRYAELERFIQECRFARGVKLVDGGYDPDPFYEMAKGREEDPERGPRCYLCYELRLRKTAEYADSHKYDFYTTTLSISPYKNAEWINEIGKRVEEEMEMEGNFLYSDFKKKNGYKRSIELSAEFQLYRQDYCGCEYSRRDRDRKRNGEN